MPIVSVVTPVYNGAEFIANNIRSVMAQTFTDWEHIIVDDCSTDNTVEIIKSFPHVRLIQQAKNGGPACALNEGFRHAAGEYFAWVSADDGYLPDYIERATRTLKNNPDMVCVDAAVYFVDPQGYILMARNHHPRPSVTPFDLLRSNPVHGSSTMFRRRVFEELGGFNEELIGTPDTDMWIRMCAKGKIGHIPELTTFCTRHPNQDSRKRGHLVTQNLEWLADQTVRDFGLSALIPEGKGNSEAEGWFNLALTKVGTSDNSLALKWMNRAIALEPTNMRFRAARTFLPMIGEAKFAVRARIAPTAVRYRANKSREAGRNVHTLIDDRLNKQFHEMAVAA